MVSSDWYNLDQDNTLGGNNPSILKIPSQKAIKEALDTKQDVLTAGTNISIVSATPTPLVDTRSTATIVNAGTTRWQGVAYGNGIFIAVGNYGYVAYSSDGATWSTPTTVGTQTWYSITFANGKFVAVGNSGYTTTTTDGQTWTTPIQVSGLSNRLQSVRYGNGVFCAVGFDAKSIISSDGLTWSSYVITESAAFDTVLYDGTKFVCPNRQNNYIYTSTNGESWTRYNINKSMTQKSSSAYGNGVYVIGSDATGSVMYSTDLTSWSTPIEILDKVESIYWTGTQFIAVGRRAITSSSYKYSTITSTDGQTWTTPVDIGNAASSTVIQYGFLSITYGNGKFVAVGDSGATTTFEITYSQGGTIINGAEIVSAVDSTSTNSECVGAKLFYDTVGDIESALNTINSGSST